MKKLILVCLPTLLLSAAIAVLPTSAEVERSATAISQVTEMNLSPFNLTFLAYQGYLEGQGIPGSSALIQKYLLKEINAKQVVEAAVRSNRLTPHSLNDLDYLHDVDLQLMSLSRVRE